MPINPINKKKSLFLVNLFIQAIFNAFAPKINMLLIMYPTTYFYRMLDHQKLIFSLFLCLYFGVQAASYAQSDPSAWHLSGHIRAADSGETLVGASIWSQQLAKGSVTNVYGFYSLRIPKDQIEGADSIDLQISFIGYETVLKRLSLANDQQLDFDLSPAAEVLEEFIVTDEGEQDWARRDQMGVEKVNIKQLKAIPMMLGEADLLKAIQLSAGVQTGNEGSAGFLVRGGAQSQNLILLDEATVYNPGHVFGFFSVFNSAIIKNARLFKGDFPARYGGRLSGILDVHMQEGNMRDHQVRGGIGLVASNLTIEGPLKKDKASYLFSGRRTYADLFVPLVNRALPEDAQRLPASFFYDLNAKFNVILGKKDRLFISAYFGQDQVAGNYGKVIDNVPQNTYDITWGNWTGTLRWNHIFGPRVFSNTSFIVSRFQYDDAYIFRQFTSYESGTSVYDYSFREDIDFFLNEQHHIRLGAQFTHYQIEPVDFQLRSGISNTDTNAVSSSTFLTDRQRYLGNEFAFYLSDDWTINSRLQLDLGLRWSGFYGYDKKFYHQPEPRASLKFKANERLSTQVSYARMAQYLHQVPNSQLSFADPWFLSNQYIAPETADQVSIGWKARFLEHLTKSGIQITNEYYYKWLYDQLDYQNAAEYLFIDENYHERLTTGSGYSYGAEWSIAKTDGKFTGALNYTLSWSWRQFEDLNGGEAFPFTYDRRHVVHITGQYQLPKKWGVNANWTYRTGQALDLPLARFFLFGTQFRDLELVPVYTDLNAFRMPAYHRLDIGFTKKFEHPKREKYSADLSFGVYNAYSRLNAFFIYYEDETVTDENGNASVRFFANQTALFPAIPYVSYNFSF